MVAGPAMSTWGVGKDGAGARITRSGLNPRPVVLRVWSRELGNAQFGPRPGPPETETLRC